MHVAVDEYSRVACVEILPDETPTPRSVGWFAMHGVRAREVISDGGAVTSLTTSRARGRDWASSTSAPRANRPRATGTYPTEARNPEQRGPELPGTSPGSPIWSAREEVEATVRDQVSRGGWIDGVSEDEGCDDRVHAGPDRIGRERAEVGSALNGEEPRGSRHV